MRICKKIENYNWKMDLARINRYTQDYYSACTHGFVGNLEMLEALGFMEWLRDGEDVVNGIDKDYVIDGGIKLAIANGRREVLRFLHEHGIDVFQFGEMIDFAVRNGHYTIAVWILEEIEPQFWNNGIVASNFEYIIRNHFKNMPHPVAVKMTAFFARKKLNHDVRNGQNVKDCSYDDDDE